MKSKKGCIAVLCFTLAVVVVSGGCDAAPSSSGNTSDGDVVKTLPADLCALVDSTNLERLMPGAEKSHSSSKYSEKMGWLECTLEVDSTRGSSVKGQAQISFYRHGEFYGEGPRREAVAAYNKCKSRRSGVNDRILPSIEVGESSHVVYGAGAQGVPARLKVCVLDGIDTLVIERVGGPVLSDNGVAVAREIASEILDKI